MKGLIIKLLLITAIFSFSIVFVYSQTMPTVDNGVAYELPYAGLLPDHPLYIFKAARDQFTVWSTRDYLKKAQLYLLYSDKRLVMGQQLIKRGKSKMAITTVSKGEKYFLKIPDILETTRKQGAEATQDFVNKVKLSNAKHIEIIEKMAKEVPQGEENSLTDTLNLSLQIREQLKKF